jgi:hypothetical protein
MGQFGSKVNSWESKRQKETWRSPPFFHTQKAQLQLLKWVSLTVGGHRAIAG